MKRTFLLRHALVAAAAVSVAVSVSACAQNSASDATPKSGLAIVTGSRNNMPRPSLDGGAARAADAAINSGSVLASVVVADGQPKEAEHGVLVVNAKNGTAREQQRTNNRQQLDQAINSARAKTPETDLLSSLILAQRAISSAPSPRTIIVVDSGLSTAGQLNFTRPGMLDADPQEVADYLAKADELPDLSGDNVVFEGLGDVAAPQEKLDEARRKNVIEIWRAVSKAAHAKSVTIEQTPLPGTPPAGLPPVTPVELSHCVGNTVVLTGGDVAFKPNSAELLDPAAAAATLRPMAQRMVDGDLRAKLTGTTANVGDKAGQQRLSLQRARTVMALLASLEVRADRMTAVGRGSDFDGYVQDHDSAGNLIPWAAAANRKVVVQLIGGQVTC